MRITHTYHLAQRDYHRTSISTQAAPHAVATRASKVVGLQIGNLTARISPHHLRLQLPKHFHLEPEQCL